MKWLVREGNGEERAWGRGSRVGRIAGGREGRERGLRRDRKEGRMEE